jgi:hypothetical protein
MVIFEDLHERDCFGVHRHTPKAWKESRYLAARESPVCETYRRR